MQNFVPESMRLNKFQHVELPDNSMMFLRMQGRTIPTGNPDVQYADFFSRKTEQYIQEEQKLLEDYQAHQNKLDKEKEEYHSKVSDSSQTQSE